MSLKLTTSLSQRLVLTPQLRQRIEMLQMTSLELNDLIQQQLLENPVLEEVATQDEKQELEEKILDHTAGAEEAAGGQFTAEAPEGSDLNGASPNGAGDVDSAIAYAEAAEGEAGVAEEFSTGTE